LLLSTKDDIIQTISEINPLTYSQSQLRNLPKEQWGGNFTENIQWLPFDYYWERTPFLEQLNRTQLIAHLTQVSLHCKAVLRRMQEQNPNKKQPWMDRLARPKVRERIEGHKRAKNRQNIH